MQPQADDEDLQGIQQAPILQHVSQYMCLHVAVCGGEREREGGGRRERGGVRGRGRWEKESCG